MKETAEAYLEGVYKEFAEYREYYKSIHKSPEERKKEIVKTILDNKEDTEKIIDSVFTYNLKYSMYEKDILELHKRLAHTVTAYQDLIEIPEEVKKDVENYKLLQAFSIKNGEAIEVNSEYSNQIRENLRQNYDRILKEFEIE